MENLVELIQQFTDDGILICFNGALSHSLIEELGNAAKTYLKERELKLGIMSDVFSVYIEQTQNVRNYINIRQLSNTKLDRGIIKISSRNGDYTVSSGNYILKSDVLVLKEKLDSLKVLDKKELRKRYKDQMRREVPEGAMGAGLGLIDMARKASYGLEYAFNSIDSDHDFFTLSVTIKGA